MTQDNMREWAEKLAEGLDTAARQLAFDYGNKDPEVAGYRQTLDDFYRAMIEMDGQQTLALAGQNEEESE